LSKVKELSGKNHFNIGLAWVVAIYVMFETLWSIYEVGMAQVYAFKNKNNTEIQHADAKKKVEESSFSFLDEVAFMYQNKKVAIQTAACAFYNYFFMLRWVFFSFIAITWHDKPRSIYIVFFIVDFFFIAYTIFTLKSFRSPAGCMILISEILIFARHIAQLAFFGDQGRNASMKQGGVDFWTHISWWSYIFGTFIEIVLWFEPYFDRARHAPVVAAPAHVGVKQ
jgi:hypothetical protein